MKRTLFLMASAVLCGILAMFLPLYIWHQANFPDKPATLSNLREEVPEYYKANWGLLEPAPITPLYAALAISFAISLVAYAFFKRRL
ncbi:MAG: hypothetical protein ACP5LB_03060 [Candidatus Bathyarchaeia archaeon]